MNYQMELVRLDPAIKRWRQGPENILEHNVAGESSWRPIDIPEQWRTGHRLSGHATAHDGWRDSGVGWRPKPEIIR